jgi:hypothetical protein
MRRILMLAAGLTVLALSIPAQATMVHYMSQHPLPRKMGGGFCYIDAPHVHDFGPSDPRMYRQMDGQYYFVGDPSPFDYQGPRTAYYGPHPVVEANVQFGQPVYCYLQGPHYHWYQPPPQASFELRGGAYWFTGAYEPAYYDQRSRYVGVNEAYAPIAYERPIVDVTVAPPSFHGEIVGGGPGWRGRAVVGAPVVSAGVVVAPPPPVQVGIGINLGGPPPVVIERDYYEREHHDHGRHRGWYKDGRGDGWRGEGRGDGWRGGPAPQRGGGWRGAPPPAPHQGGGWRGAPPAASHPGGGGWRGNAAPAPQPGGGWRGSPAPQRGGGGGGKQDHGNGWRR